MSRTTNAVAAWALGLSAIAGAASAQQATLTWLGTIDEGSDCVPWAISADGEVVAGKCSRPFKWSRTHGMQPLAPLPQSGFYYVVNDISADGSVVVGFAGSLGPLGLAVRWPLEGATQDLGFVSQSGQIPYSQATNVSSDGSVYGVTNDGYFVWTADQGIRLLNYYFRGVSDDGRTIFGIDASGLFLWTADRGVERFAQPPCVNVGDYLSGDGSTIIGVCGVQIYRWRRETGFLPVPTPFGGLAGLSAVSGDGRVILGYAGDGAWISIEDEGFHGLVADLLRQRGVDIGDWDFDGATAVNNDGTVIAGAAHIPLGPTGNLYAWVAHLRPSCGTSDYNHDGDSGTDLDIEDFFRCLSGDCCTTCYTDDINGDGVGGDDADIEAFFKVLAGGNC